MVDSGKDADDARNVVGLFVPKFNLHILGGATMADEIKVFENQEFGTVRTTIIDGEPWFIAVDVCNALEISNPTQALARLDSDEKMILCLTEGHSGQRGGARSVNIVNEPGLYTLVLGSRKPEAKAFKRWITHDVIPDVRKHGAYMTPETIEKVLTDPDTIIKLATQLKDEREARIRLEQENKILLPKAEFADAISATEDSILIKHMASLLSQNGFKTGQNRLFKLLRDDGYLCSTRDDRWNTPTQTAIDKGLFTVEEHNIRIFGQPQLKVTTRVTPKGQKFFLRKYTA